VPDRGEPLAILARWRADVLVVAAAVLPLALFVVRERQIAGASGFPLDDSWIHLHFARNLAAGAGFSYNPGTPVAGSTAPLWTLLLGAAAVVAAPTLAMAKALGIVATLGAALVTRRAALAWGARRDVALFASIVLLWMGPVIWGALSGMEVSLAALLVAAALLAHAHDHPLASAACGALAVLARPEALLLVPLLVAARPMTVRRIALFAVVTLVVVSPAILFSLWTAGTPYPATAAAKVEGGLVGWLGGVREPAALTFVTRPLAFFTEWIVWLVTIHWLLPVALVPAIIVTWKYAGRPLGLVTLALVVHPLGMALLAPYRGPAFQEGRYSIHLLPLAVVVVAVALGTRRRGGGRSVDQRSVASAAEPVRALHAPATSTARRYGWAGPVALVVWLALAAAALVPAATRYGWAVQNINAMQVHLGRWVDAQLPKTARLALNDIGAIAFFSRREVIDLMGLVTPQIIPYRRRGESGVMEYISETCPEYVIIFPAWFPRLAASTETLQPIYRVRLERNEVEGAAEMVVYRLLRCAV
jgi:arabinofuranosyltransferase